MASRRSCWTPSSSVFAGARGVSEWSRLYRLPRATPRFDVGRYREIARFESVQLDQRRSGRRLYFAGDYLMDPSWNGALLSGQRAARAVHADLSGRLAGSRRAIVTPSPPSPGPPGSKRST